MKTLDSEIDEYLAQRRQAGYQLASAALRLKAFARYCKRRGCATVTAREAVRWSGQGTSRLTRVRRLRVIRQFVLWTRVKHIRHEVPQADCFGRDRPRRAVPYILSQNEIRQLVRGTRTLRRAGATTRRVLEVLFGLLVCTGMRIGEALALRCDDVTSNGVLIRHDKRGKGRLLPLHKTTHRVLEDFLNWRLRIPTQCDYLFINTRGQKLDYGTVYSAFWRIVARDGIGKARGSRRLCIHSLRHSFAVRTLQQGYRNRDEVGLHMKVISEYLGHVNIACTYWYYEGTPELMIDIVKECEHHEKQ